ncbi:hypothetical protein N0V90_008432 [Kalmusia sp. IMI 367209]|nr:hypothetical protein N0V90_008432 [Kalmusia sp. IMI 367209]
MSSSTQPMSNSARGTFIHNDLEILTNPPKDDCAVCYHPYIASTSAAQSNEPTIDTTAVRIKQCSHVFHRSCLLAWLEQFGNHTCPTCRTELFTGADDSAYAPPYNLHSFITPRLGRTPVFEIDGIESDDHDILAPRPRRSWGDLASLVHDADDEGPSSQPTFEARHTNTPSIGASPGPRRAAIIPEPKVEPADIQRGGRTAAKTAQPHYQTPTKASMARSRTATQGTANAETPTRGSSPTSPAAGRREATVSRGQREALQRAQRPTLASSARALAILQDRLASAAASSERGVRWGRTVTERWRDAHCSSNRWILGAQDFSFNSYCGEGEWAHGDRNGRTPDRREGESGEENIFTTVGCVDDSEEFETGV